MPDPENPRQIEHPLMGIADIRVIGDLMEDLRAAWEKILNDYSAGTTSAGNLSTERGGVRYVDAMMATHNFHKLAVINICADAGFTGRPAAEFYLGCGATFMKAMRELADKIRDDSERKHP